MTTLRLARVAGLFLAGATIGTLLDRIHVASGVLWYTHPTIAGQAAWVPFVFGVGALLLMTGHRIVPPRANRAAPFSVVAPAFALVVAYVATALLADRPLLLASVLTLAWLGRLLRQPALDTLAVGAAFAVGGPLFEAALSATGGFFSRHPDVLGVPIWLPALYLHVAFLTRQIARVWP